jgi:hypothetical protein
VRLQVLTPASKKTIIRDVAPCSFKKSIDVSEVLATFIVKAIALKILLLFLSVLQVLSLIVFNR